MAIQTYQGTVRDMLSRLDSRLGDREHKVYGMIERQEALTDALQVIHGQIASVGPDMLTKTATISFVAGTLEYALPDDFYRPVRVYVDNGSTSYYEVKNVRPQSIGEVAEGWYVRADKVGVYFGSAPTGTVTLEYIYLPAWPTDITDPVEGVPDNWISAIVDYAAMSVTKDWRQADRLRALYNDKMKFLLDQAASRSFSYRMSAARDNGVEV